MDNEVSTRTTIIAFLIVAVVVIGGIAVLMTSQPEPVHITINPPEPTYTPAPTATPEPIIVYVTGAVAQPESMVTLPYGSRVEDALEAAGGVLDDANLQQVTLAGILHDGDQVHVPVYGADETDEAEVMSIDALATPSGGPVVYINTATLEELETLPGVGPVMAQRIIEYREENGSFTDLEDLDNVSGIGPATLENLSELISFE